MNRGKKLLLLLLSLAVLSAAAFAIVKSGDNASSDSGEDGSVKLLSLDPGSVDFISWERDGETFSFSRSGDGWVCDSNSELPISSGSITNLLGILSELTAAMTVQNAGELAEYGLTSPACRITVQSTQNYSLSIGDAAAIGDLRYFSTGDGSVYLVNSAVLDCFPDTLDVLVEQDAVDEPQATPAAE